MQNVLQPWCSELTPLIAGHRLLAQNTTEKRFAVMIYCRSNSALIGDGWYSRYVPVTWSIEDSLREAYAAAKGLDGAFIVPESSRLTILNLGPVFA